MRSSSSWKQADRPEGWTQEAEDQLKQAQDNLGAYHLGMLETWKQNARRGLDNEAHRLELKDRLVDLSLDLADAEAPGQTEEDSHLSWTIYFGALDRVRDYIEYMVQHQMERLYEQQN